MDRYHWAILLHLVVAGSTTIETYEVLIALWILVSQSRALIDLAENRDLIFCRFTILYASDQ